MESSSFTHKTAKFNSAEAQELPQVPPPHTYVMLMGQVEEQAMNLSPPQVLASSLDLLENLRPPPGLPELAASLCSVGSSGSKQNGQRHHPATGHPHYTPGNSRPGLALWLPLHSTCLKNK